MVPSRAASSTDGLSAYGENRLKFLYNKSRETAPLTTDCSLSVKWRKGSAFLQPADGQPLTSNLPFRSSESLGLWAAENTFGAPGAILRMPRMPSVDGQKTCNGRPRRYLRTVRRTAPGGPNDSSTPAVAHLCPSPRTILPDPPASFAPEYAGLPIRFLIIFPDIVIAFPTAPSMRRPSPKTTKKGTLDQRRPPSFVIRRPDQSS